MCGTTVCDCGLCHECEIDWEEEEEDDDEERGNCDNDSEEVSLRSTILKFFSKPVQLS